MAATEIKIEGTVIPAQGKMAWGFPNIEYEFVGGPSDGAFFVGSRPFTQIDMSVGPRWIGTYYPGNRDEKKARLLWSPNTGA